MREASNKLDDVEQAVGDAPDSDDVQVIVKSMILQGFPSEWLHEAVKAGISDPQLKDLAGNTFSATVFGCVYICTLAHLPAPTHTPDIFDSEAIAQLLMP